MPQQPNQPPKTKLGHNIQPAAQLGKKRKKEIDHLKQSICDLESKCTNYQKEIKSLHIKNAALHKKIINLQHQIGGLKSGSNRNKKTANITQQQMNVQSQNYEHKLDTLELKITQLKIPTNLINELYKQLKEECKNMKINYEYG